MNVAESYGVHGNRAENTESTWATTVTRARRGEFNPGDQQNEQINIKKVAPLDNGTMPQASLQYACLHGPSQQ